jgi:hypothetical protein
MGTNYARKCGESNDGLAAARRRIQKGGLMEIANPTAKRRKAVLTRVFWFLIGGVVNYILIATPFNYLTRHTTLPDGVKVACSLAVSAAFFFPWNYFVNFRTGARKRDAFPRFLATYLTFFAISTVLLTSFKKIKGGFTVMIWGHNLDLDIITMQLCMGWVKFLVYHKWAFPAPKAPATSANPNAQSEGTQPPAGTA